MRLRMKLSRVIPIEVDVEIGERSLTVMSPKIAPALVFSDASRGGPILPARPFITAPSPIRFKAAGS